MDPLRCPLLALRWPWSPPDAPLPPEIRIELPEAVQRILEGAIESAFYAGLAQGAMAAGIAVLLLWAIFGKK